MSKNKYYKNLNNAELDTLDLNDPETRVKLDPNFKQGVTDPNLDLVGTGVVTGDAPNPDAVITPIVLTPEEETYRKRYGDLRTFQQKEAKEAKDRITALEDQLRNASKKELVLPKSDAEYDAWAKEFPDVAGIMETIAIKKSKEVGDDIEARLAQVEILRKEADMERAMNAIRKKHPEFDDYKADAEFHKWAEEQPKWIKDALYINDTDASAVVRVLDLYKLDKGLNKPASKAQDNRAAATTVRPKTERTEPASTEDNSNKWSESRIQKLSEKEYDRYEAEIIAAQKAGKIVYDITGAAR